MNNNTDAIIKEIAQLLGAEQVIAADSEQAANYREKIDRILRTVSYGKESRQIIAIATPGSNDDLKALLNLAKSGNFALWTMPNAGGLGSTPPPQSGDIVMLDLKRMNAILEVNTSAAYALVEPGVTYQQMQQYLRENNIPFWVDIDKSSRHSIADSIGAREFGFTPYGDHLLMQCGMEVMLANGSVVRTGMGAMPRSNTWQLFKYGYGPYVDGLFTQSNLGIVTKVGVWLMPAPPAYKPFAVAIDDQQSLEAVIDVLHSFKVNMLIPNTIAISDARYDAIKYAGESPETALSNDELAEKHKIGRWNAYGALYGLPDNVDILWKATHDALSSVPGASIRVAEDFGDQAIWAGREQTMRGLVTDTEESTNPDHAFVRFTLGAAIEGKEATTVGDTIQAIAEQHQITALSEFALTWRTMMARVQLPYELGKQESLERARTCATDILGKLSEQGFGATHADSDILLDATETFQNADINTLQQRVKNALDPESVFG